MFARSSRLWPALLLISVIGCGGAPKVDRAPDQGSPPSAAELTDRERQLHLASFDRVWETIEAKHWDPEHGGVDWPALRDELRPHVEEARTAAEAREVLNRLVASLGQSHFGVFPPDVYAEIEGEEIEDEGIEDSDGANGGDGVSRTTVRSGETTEIRPERPTRNREGDGDIGFDIAIVENVALVSRVAARSPASRTGIGLGWILAEIDGRPVARTIERFRSSMEQGGGEMELMLRYSVLRRLRGDAGDEVELLFLDGRDDPVPVTLTLDPPRGELFRLGHMPPMRVDWDLARENDIAYFRLSSFFDPARVMPELRSFVEENLDARGFVIDLRGNPGGIGFMANGICGLFVEEAGQSLGTMYMRDGELKFGIFPQATTYVGPLAVLIDGGSASTSEILAGGLRDIGRARLFGSRTAGAALPSTFERLPNGDGFQYAIANYISAGGEVLEGEGVAPDVPVALERVTLLDGRDPVIEAARAWIEEEHASIMKND